MSVSSIHHVEETSLATGLLLAPLKNVPSNTSKRCCILRTASREKKSEVEEGSREEKGEERDEAEGKEKWEEEEDRRIYVYYCSLLKP